MAVFLIVACGWCAIAPAGNAQVRESVQATDGEVQEPSTATAESSDTPTGAESGGSSEGQAGGSVDRRSFGEEITVTGQQQERTLSETTDSVVVSTGRQLESSTVVDLYDLVASTPNVNASFGQKGFAVRGIDQRGFGSGSGLLVSVRVDGGTVINNQASFFGPYSAWDLGQVEIFRGPQSTQQGRNSLAGAIVIRSADPSYEREVKARASLAELGTRQASAALNLPLIQDKLALRVSVDQRQTDGWVENPTRAIDDYDARDALTARAKLRFDPTPRLNGLISFSFTDSTGGEDAIDAAFFPGRRINTSDSPAIEGSEHQITTLELRYLLGSSWILESVSNIYGHDYERFEDGDQGPAPGNTVQILRDDSSFSQQLRLLFQGADRLSGVVGLYYADLEGEQDSSAVLPGPVFNLPPVVTITGSLSETTDTRNLAVFGEVDWRLGADWVLTAGARFDDEDKTSRNLQDIAVNPPVVTLPTNPPELLDSNYQAFLPKLAMTRVWNDDLSTSFSVQRGYRAGGRSQSLVSQTLSDFGPEYTWNYEAALRSSWLQGRLDVNANTFYIDWQDQQVSVRTPLNNQFDQITVNAGRSRLFGLEAQANYRLNNRWSVYASFGFVDTKFIEFVDGELDLSGNEFPFAPEWSWSLGLRGQLTERISLKADLNSQAETFSDERNTAEFAVDDRTILNIKAGRDWENWGLFLVVRNVLDEDYLVQRFDGGARSGEPRVLGLEWNLKF